MKGVELGTTKLMSEVIEEVAKVPSERVAVLSGPNLAKEIAARQPAAAVVACSDEAVATRFQAACHTPYFRPYTNTDVVGCELGGAVKNVIALAVGIADGMGLGDNTKASLMTRGLAETARLGEALGADPHTFAGLAGMGDLVATCSSPLSRNHTFGMNLGRGLTLAETVAATKQTAEGVKSSVSVRDLARRHGVDMPITETVVSIVHDGKPPLVAVKELMARSAKSERR
jgi:glycerol-3-phosphate dehydrogenase (NAD(P)+)